MCIRDRHYHCPDLPFEPEMVEHTTVLALDVAAMTGKRRTDVYKRQAPRCLWIPAPWM